MIDGLSPGIRKLLVRCRCQAMEGDADGATDRLAEAGVADATVLEQIAAAMLRAELLYLDCRENESLVVFDQDILPRLDDMSYAVRAAVEDNRNVVASRCFETKAAGDFYGLVDERRLAGIHLWDEHAAMIADTAVSEGKHYDALPGYWQQLLKSYHKGYWRSYVWASKRMSKECLCLGWFDKAAYHALGAQEDEVAEEIGESLLQRRDPVLIAKTVKTLLRTAHLKRHACVAAALVRRVGDAIPKEDVEAVMEWLTALCSIEPGTWPESAAYNQAWSAMEAIVPLLDPEQALQVAERASGHCCWTQPSFHREKLISTMNTCVAVVHPEALPKLVEPSLALVTEAKWDHDYVHAVNLLCHVAARGDNAVKASLARVLYRSQSQVGNPILLQVAPIFGQLVAKPDELCTWADEVSAQVLLQVQHLAKGDEPANVGLSFGKIVRESKDEKVVVHLSSSCYDLGSLAAHRELLSTAALSRIIASMCKMIEDQQNVLANRIGLIHTLGEFADRIGGQLAADVMRTLLPLAEGVVAEEPGSDSLSADNPLNRFKMRMGDPSQARGVALLTLALIEKASPSCYGGGLHTLLEKAFSSPDAAVRRWAFLAAHKLPTLPESALSALLVGSRDPDPTAAAWAVRALADRSDLELSQGNWHALVYSLTLAVQSSDAMFRAATAIAAARLIGRAPSDDLRAKMTVLKECLATDICHSVRNALDTAIAEWEHAGCQRETTPLGC